MEILDLQDNNYSIENFGQELPDLELAINEISNLAKNAIPNKKAKTKANKIAKDCFMKMIKKYS